MCRIIFILIFMLIRFGHMLEVQFKPSHPTNLLSLDQDTPHLHKRNMPQFYDKAAFNFDGLVGIASVPVPYPLDICMLQLPTIKYATVLHKERTGGRLFAVYGWQASGEKYELLLQVPAAAAVTLDCLAYAGRGYVALSYNLTEPAQQAQEGSPIYELSPDTGIRTVQYFGAAHLRDMYLRISSQELTLLQTYDEGAGHQRCPYFKWTGATFERLGSIPCSNARQLEAFGIDFADYVAVANYADADGHTNAHSEIYRYNADLRRFELFQRLRSNGAVDVKYFSVPQNEVSRRHFLVLGNTVGRAGGNDEADTVFYVFDQGQFVPYQRLSFYALQRLLPVQHVIAEKFLLLVACNKQDVKIYNLNDWKFEESKVQFTEGAFGKGVSHMRSYEEDEQSYLVIANELMNANETNIFRPLYKQDEHANALRQQILEWAHAQSTRLQNLNVEHILQDVQKLKLSSNGALHNPQIRRVNTKSLVDERKHLSPNYWDALRYAKRALDAIERQSAHYQPSTLRRLVRREVEYEFDDIMVENLVVHKNLQADHINGINSHAPVYNTIKTPKVYIREPNGKELPRHRPTHLKFHIEDLQLNGTLNGLNWTQLLDQTLKCSGVDVQFIKAPATISNLAAETVMVNSNKMNDRSLDQLIPTDGGDYIVQHDVQFAHLIKVNRLEINQRLNNIHVDRRHFDVLLKKSNETQIIEGSKHLENLKVLEPINMAGQMLGTKLRAISPMKVIHHSLQLHGDYVIGGDVTIGERLTSLDLVDATTQKSSVSTLQQGVQLNATLQNINLRFEQALNSKDTELSFINAHDLQHLLELNVDNVQVIQGEKHLPQSLEVSEGFSEVKWLNDIDVVKLEQQLLLRTGNQSIRKPMRLAGLKVKQLTTSQVQLLLNDQTTGSYLTRQGDQHGNSTLYIQRLYVPNELNTREMYVNGNIYERHLSDIYSLGKSAQSFALPSNFNGTIFAKNLWLKTSMNDFSVSEVEQQLQQLLGNVKYVGDFNFGHATNISGLRFDGTLNGISALEFGSCWLEIDGDQNFISNQRVAGVESVLGIWLNGHLNNYTVADYRNETYKLNESEIMQTVRFENPIVVQLLEVHLLNNLRLPEDFLYATPDAISYMQAPISVNGSLHSSLCNVSSLNGIEINALEQYLGDQKYDVLYVEHVQFENSLPPNYGTLNRRNLKHIINEVWLTNENIVLGNQGQRVQLTRSIFEGLLEFEGAINGMSAAHIKHNYFSLTRSHQHVHTALNLKHDVTFAQPLTANRVMLRGKIKSDIGALVEGEGNKSLDFDEFVYNTLKTWGNHTVTGNWSILDAYVLGNLSFVHLNHLNLVNDVLRSDATNAVKYISAPKTVHRALIKRLYTTPPSTVAGVPVKQWIDDAVYIYGNHSIIGITTLEKVNLYNNLCVEGSVNDIAWKQEKLLLRDAEQHVEGMLLVENTLPQEQRILTNNIEELWVDRIRELSVNDLIANKATNRPNLHIESQLIFNQPLAVRNYQVGINPSEAPYKWKRGLKSMDTDEMDYWQDMTQQLAHVQQRLADPPYVLEDFTLLQQLPLNASRVEVLNVDALDVLCISKNFSKERLNTTYYVWQPSEERFILNTNLSALIPHNKMHLHYKSGFSPFIATSAPNSYLMSPLLHLMDLDCLAFRPDYDQKLHIHCLDKRSYNRTVAVIARTDIKQLLPLVPNDASVLLLLLHNKLEFWHWRNDSYAMELSMSMMHAEQIALAHYDSRRYLAVLIKHPGVEKSAGTVEIYSAVNDLAPDYKLEQSIDFDVDMKPRQLLFMQLSKSNDLLLCISTTSLTQPLRIYQQKGVSGFQLIVGASTLPAIRSLFLLQLRTTQRQFLAFVATEGGVFILEPLLKSL
ncbi:uncharacterized protein LOC115633710 [Scaptodrosophila lebanonensis]|uniref:Uncharacterized protein LOC115633710 n=1 Tax=Drosophila lebanonensis TaxID=7225 RepID=A0A6J2UEY6_DROLE|nr:uncharacterized protein LOC115633710 [Scaptodrosophila lebanonensis]